VLAGLQGGLLNLVESTHEHKTNTDKTLANLTEITNKILDRVSAHTSPQSKCVNTQSANTKEINQVKDSVNQLQNVVCKKISSLTEHIESLEDQVKASADIHNHLSSEMMNSFEETNRQSLRDITKVMDTNNKNLSVKMTDIQKSVNKPVTNNTHITEKSRGATEITSGERSIFENLSNHRSPVSHTNESLSDGHTDRRTNMQSNATALSRQQGGQSHNKTAPVAPSRSMQHTEPTRESVPQTDTRERKTLLVGDSTTKLIDKRRVIHHSIISKCRAATIADAFHKIRTGGTHQMDKIIFCVGLNDLRDGNSIDQVVDDMKCLIEETQYRHAGWDVYVCSILPAVLEQVSKQTIERVNSNFEHFQRYIDNVHYVDITSEFVSHDPHQQVFEEDRIHPNLKGSIIMASVIRNRLRHDHKPLRHFVSKRTNTTDLSYADSVRARPVEKQQHAIHVAAGYQAPVDQFVPGVQETVVNHSRDATSLHPYRAQTAAFSSGARYFPTNGLWPTGGGYYPQMIPMYPQATPMYPQTTHVYPQTTAAAPPTFYAQPTRLENVRAN
jgi:hypothetical protein